MLSVWVEAGNPEATFWGQTPKTFQAVLDGCARREERIQATVLAAGWHSANFNRAKHLKDLGHYLQKLKTKYGPGNPADEAAAIFEGFASQGLVKIREVPKKEKANG